MGALAKKATAVDRTVGYWREQISKQQKAYSDFQAGGDRVIDRYRIEKNNAQQDSLQDRYNILYSSTETMRPSLYAQTPKVQVTQRHRDRKNPVVKRAINLLETTVSYAVDEIDFDEVMENVIEDYLLPGLGHAWVRYEPTFKDQTNDAGEVVNGEDGKPNQVVDMENIHVDHVSWKDTLFGPCRTFKELPWAAKRVYMGKERAINRFGDAAKELQYSDKAVKTGDQAGVIEDAQACIWEIWDKTKRQVIWIADGYDKVLDKKADPLRLKKFWPFPKPMRAISNTRTFVPRPFYAQYQSQAEELDHLTSKIRHLTNALNVRGVYDGSQDKLAALLNPRGGNKLIAVENWHQFIGQSGINGAIQWVPIDIIVKVLMELYNARERAKAEIYEITGFSDIVRGMSKASETLGAQQIKQDWATGRLRIMQKEVQRFCKEIIAIIAEIAAEHFSEETFALYSGFELPPAAPPPPPPVAGQPAPPPMPDPQQVAVQGLTEAIALLRKERERCAVIGIETDSTILPDEQNEQKARLEFLSSIGAFMQQAAPTTQQFPQMAGLLGAMMMFSVRSFRAARPIEAEFEKFQEALAVNPPKAPDQNGGDAAKAQSALQIAQMRQQGEQQKQAAELQFKASEAEKDRQLEMQKLAAQAQEAQVQLQIKNVELQIKQAELALKQGQAQQQAIDAEHDRALEANDQAHRHDMERTGHAQGAYEFEASGARSDRQQEASEAQAAAQAAQNNPQGSAPGA